MGILILLFVVVPLAELALLLQVADAIGGWQTFALVLVTGVVGASLARWQGWRTLLRIQSQLAQQQMPTQALLDGAMILVAGAFLLTPGIMTDALGFSLLLPPCRRVYRGWLARHFRGKFQVQTWTTQASPSREDVVDADGWQREESPAEDRRREIGG